MADVNDEGDFKTDINLYEKGRPDYSKESIHYLLQKLGVLEESDSKPLTILEIGAGTGKFTRVLVDVLESRSNVRIIASDSQASMCEKFKKIIPNVEIMHFKAENIKLPDASVDVVIVAQAFHWFANPQSVAEIHRVLVPSGSFGMIWNSRNYREVDWVAKLQAIIEPYFQRDNNPNNLDNSWQIPIKDSGLFSPLEGNEDLRIYQEGSADDIVTAVMCLSSISKSSDDEKKEVEKQIRDLLANHPDLKGKVVYHLPYIVPIYWCKKL